MPGGVAGVGTPARRGSGSVKTAILRVLRWSEGKAFPQQNHIANCWKHTTNINKENMISALGRWTIKKIKGLLYAMGFFFQVITEAALFIRRKQVAVKVLVMQIYFTGVKALSIISFIALALGVIIIIQGKTLLPQLGQGSLLYTILIIIITRELGPILTAFIVIARSGTAIAAEIGDMVVTHQIEAYLATGINPISYLIVPRFLGVTISLMLLTLYFNIVGLFASYLFTQIFSPMPFAEYFQKLMSTLQFSDIIISILKSFIFGVIISLVATHNALKVKTASTEIPQVVIRSVGQGFILCIVANVFVTLLYYI
jgi:phospholipid/cholesterol/gamma-HCH transport system permease protein